MEMMFNDKICLNLNPAII